MLKKTRNIIIILTAVVGLLVLSIAPATALVQHESSLQAQLRFVEAPAAAPVKVIDLSYDLSPQTSVWPGTPPMEIETVVTYEKDGYYANVNTIHEHYSTHMDSPAHFVKGQLTIDAIPAGNLVGPAVVVDVRDKVAANPDYQLTVDDLKAWEAKYGAIPEGAIVFMWSGWGEKFTDQAAYQNMDADKVMHFPGFSLEAANYLLEKEVNGLGLDTLSFDYGPSKDFAVHFAWLGAGKWAIENVANLTRSSRARWWWPGPSSSRVAPAPQPGYLP